MESIAHRYEFVLLFDVKNGNPNGDPDAGNAPRMDPQTNHGFVSDVCLKRKVRNFVMMTRCEKAGDKVFVKERAVLNELIEEPYRVSEEVRAAVDAWQAWKKNKKKVERPKRHYEDIARAWMCENCYDIRTFGAVMSTGDEQEEDGEDSKMRMTAGQVRGPVQLAFACSVEPILPLGQTVTRCAVTNEKDLEKERTMGRKEIVPYALYVAHGFVSPHLAAQTGFSAADLQLLARALDSMFEHDRSAARGEMSTRGLWFFQHESLLGNARASQLFDLVKIRRQDESRPARQFADYRVEPLTQAQMPPGVTLLEMPRDVDRLV